MLARNCAALGSQSPDLHIFARRSRRASNLPSARPGAKASLKILTPCLPGAHPAQVPVPTRPCRLLLSSFLVPLQSSHLPVSPVLSALTSPSPFFFFSCCPLPVAGSLGPLTLSPPLPQLCVPASISLPVASPPFLAVLKQRREFSQWRYPVASRTLGVWLNKRIWSLIRLPGFPLSAIKQAESQVTACASACLFTLSAFWPG